jgi:hypothetical protein
MGQARRAKDLVRGIHATVSHSKCDSEASNSVVVQYIRISQKNPQCNSTTRTIVTETTAAATPSG